MDKIRVSVKDNDKIIETMKANEAEIKSEVLAEKLSIMRDRRLCKRVEH